MPILGGMRTAAMSPRGHTYYIKWVLSLNKRHTPKNTLLLVGQLTGTQHERTQFNTPSVARLERNV